MVVINEFIVGSLGKLLRAPVCEVAVVRITDDQVGWEFRPGHQLEPGFACGSLDVPDVHEDRAFAHRERDDNQRRHVGVMALYDWCCGNDPQWLYQTTADERLFSHDHGHYFPGGPPWNEANLQGHANAANPLPHAAQGLDSDEIDQMATRISQVDGEVIVGVLASVPRSWPISDGVLAALGHFLEGRTNDVAARLRQL